MTESFPRSVHIQTPAATQEQKIQVEKLRLLLSECLQQQYAESKEWLDDATLTRFLIARSWDIKKAHEMIEYTLKWRRSRNPARYLSILSKEEERSFSNEACTGKIYITGHDKHGRVVIVFDNSCQNTKSHDDQLNFLGFILELGANGGLHDVDKYVVFINLSNFSLLNCPPMQTTKETVSMLTTCFAERLGHLVLYNPPYAFYLVLGAIKYLIDAKTFAKMVVLSDKLISTGEGATLMQDVLGEHWQSLTNAGKKTLIKGTSPGYVHDIVWPQTLRLVDSLVAKKEKQVNPSILESKFPDHSPTPANNQQTKIEELEIPEKEDETLPYVLVLLSLLLSLGIAWLLYP